MSAATRSVTADAGPQPVPHPARVGRADLRARRVRDPVLRRARATSSRASRQIFAERTAAIEGGIQKAEEAQAEADRRAGAVRARSWPGARAEAGADPRGGPRQRRRRSAPSCASARRRTPRASPRRRSSRSQAERQQALVQLRGEVGPARGRPRLAGSSQESLPTTTRQQRVVDRFLADLEQDATARRATAPAPARRRHRSRAGAGRLMRGSRLPGHQRGDLRRGAGAARDAPVPRRPAGDAARPRGGRCSRSPDLLADNPAAAPRAHRPGARRRRPRRNSSSGCSAGGCLGAAVDLVAGWPAAAGRRRATSRDAVEAYAVTGAARLGRGRRPARRGRGRAVPVRPHGRGATRACATPSRTGRRRRPEGGAGPPRCSTAGPRPRPCASPSRRAPGRAGCAPSRCSSSWCRPPPTRRRQVVAQVVAAHTADRRSSATGSRRRLGRRYGRGRGSTSTSTPTSSAACGSRSAASSSTAPSAARLDDARRRLAG